MPRGVYDRSKTKSAAPKSEKTAAKTEKKARAPYGSKKAALKEASSIASTLKAEMKKDVGTAGIGTLFEGNAGYSLAELVNMRPALTNNGILLSQLDILIGRKLDRLVTLSAPKPIVIDVPEAVEAPAATPAETPVAKAKASAPAPVAAQVAAAPLQAPIPFNPTAPASSQA